MIEWLHYARAQEVHRYSLHPPAHAPPLNPAVIVMAVFKN
jgi:hypothetical protein